MPAIILAMSSFGHHAHHALGDHRRGKNDRCSNSAQKTLTKSIRNDFFVKCRGETS